jgi:hypothetical protein
MTKIRKVPIVGEAEADKWELSSTERATRAIHRMVGAGEVVDFLTPRGDRVSLEVRRVWGWGPVHYDTELTQIHFDSGRSLEPPLIVQGEPHRVTRRLIDAGWTSPKA